MVNVCTLSYEIQIQVLLDIILDSIRLYRKQHSTLQSVLHRAPYTCMI